MVDITKKSENSISPKPVSTSQAIESSLVVLLEDNLKKIINAGFEKFKKDEKIKISDNYIEEVLIKVTEICQTSDKDTFKLACKDFVRKCVECGLPYGDYKDSTKKDEGFRTIPLLWTNKGLNKNFVPGGKDDKGLLKEEAYLDYISDTESPPFKLLWNIVSHVIEGSDKLNNRVQFERTFLYIIREEQKKPQFKPVGKHHIPYDKPLSEVWTEEIPEILKTTGKKLDDVKIEIGQNNLIFCGTGVKRDSIFCQSELPIFLRIVAENNLIAREGDKVSTDLISDIVFQGSLLDKKVHIFKIKDMFAKIEQKVKTLEKGQTLSAEEGYDIIKDLLPTSSYSSEFVATSIEPSSPSSLTSSPPMPIKRKTRPASGLSKTQIITKSPSSNLNSQLSISSIPKSKSSDIATTRSSDR